MSDNNVYKRLAEHLDALPNGYPPTEDGAELRLLQKLFTPEEAALAAELRLTPQSPKQLAERLGGDPHELKDMLKGMLRKGLIAAGRGEDGFGYAALPFAIGIYEFQVGRIDEEMSRLFEDYYMQAFGQVLTTGPALTRVVPVNETVRNDMEVRPYESAAEIVAGAKSWGVAECICRTQKEHVGDPCEHPRDVCMVLSQSENAFAKSRTTKSLTQEEAMATLKRASEAGLVHQVSNNQEGLWFICNCCTCSCGILRAMADLGIANVVARSAFVNTVNEELCITCEDCVEHCQFDALSPGGFSVQVDAARCVGCGVCVPFCKEGAMVLVRRPEEEIKPTPVTEKDWGLERAAIRGLDLDKVL